MFAAATWRPDEFVTVARGLGLGIRTHRVHVRRALGGLPGEWAGLEEKAGFEELMHEDIGWVWNSVEAAGDLGDNLERSGVSDYRPRHRSAQGAYRCWARRTGARSTACGSICRRPLIRGPYGP